MEIVSWYAKKRPQFFGISQNQSLYLPFLIEVTDWQTVVTLLGFLTNRKIRENILGDKHFSKLVIGALGVSSISILIHIWTIAKTYKLNKRNKEMLDGLEKPQAPGFNSVSGTIETRKQPSKIQIFTLQEQFRRGCFKDLPSSVLPVLGLILAFLGLKMRGLLKRGKLPESTTVGRIAYLYSYFSTISFGVFALVTIVRYGIKASKFLSASNFPETTFLSKMTPRERKIFKLDAKTADLYKDLDKIFTADLLAQPLVGPARQSGIIGESQNP